MERNITLKTVGVFQVLRDIMSETVQRLKWAMGTTFISNLVICSNSPIQQYAVCAVEMALFQQPKHQDQEVVVLAY